MLSNVILLEVTLQTYLLQDTGSPTFFALGLQFPTMGDVQCFHTNEPGRKDTPKGEGSRGSDLAQRLLLRGVESSDYWNTVRKNRQQKQIGVIVFTSRAGTRRIPSSFEQRGRVNELPEKPEKQCRKLQGRHVRRDPGLALAGKKNTVLHGCESGLE